MPEETISIDVASEGMVLAGDLRDAGGAILLPGGATLSQSTLNSLRRRGIERLAVAMPEAPEPELDPAAQQAERERRGARLRHLFRRVGDAGASAAMLARLMHYRKGE